MNLVFTRIHHFLHSEMFHWKSSAPRHGSEGFSAPCELSRFCSSVHPELGPSQHPPSASRSESAAWCGCDSTGSQQNETAVPLGAGSQPKRPSPLWQQCCAPNSSGNEPKHIPGECWRAFLLPPPSAMEQIKLLTSKNNLRVQTSIKRHRTPIPWDRHPPW